MIILIEVALLAFGFGVSTGRDFHCCHLRAIAFAGTVLALISQRVRSRAARRKEDAGEGRVD